MKIVAKNQNVRSTRCRPMIASRKPSSPATSHSSTFWAPSGTCFMFRVAICAKTMRPRATTQLTTIEFVIGKPKGRAISIALRERLSTAANSARCVPASLARVWPPLERGMREATDKLSPNAGNP